MRTGLMAEKVGMTQLFLENGVQMAVTVLKVDPCTVIAQKTEEKDGYNAVQLGSGTVAVRKLSKPLRGYFSHRQLEPQKRLKEFRVDSQNLLPVGDVLDVSYFRPGQFVDVTGVSIGKGFAGGMKRHHFGGLRATHGVSVSHRSHGSTGNRQDPGKVFKNKKMAGHMGARRVTKLNLRVHSVDVEKGLIFVKGSLPGSKRGLVYVRDAVKKPQNLD